MGVSVGEGVGVGVDEGVSVVWVRMWVWVCAVVRYNAQFWHATPHLT